MVRDSAVQYSTVKSGRSAGPLHELRFEKCLAELFPAMRIGVRIFVSAPLLSHAAGREALSEDAMLGSKKHYSTVQYISIV